MRHAVVVVVVVVSVIVAVVVVLAVVIACVTVLREMTQHVGQRFHFCFDILRGLLQEQAAPLVRLGRQRRHDRQQQAAPQHQVAQAGRCRCCCCPHRQALAHPQEQGRVCATHAYVMRSRSRTPCRPMDSSTAPANDFCVRVARQ